MQRCESCAVTLEGHWSHCPLCGDAAHITAPGETVPSPFPDPPLRYSRRRVLKILALSSLGLVVGSFLAQLFFGPDEGGIGAWRSVWLGVCAMWLVVLMALRQRRHVAKGTVYLVVVTGLVCTYWDYLTGWHGWALNFAVPIVSASSIIAVLITVRVLRVEVGEHILYSGLTAILGLAPLLFVALGWVSVPLPSLICGAVGLIAVVALQSARGTIVRHELAKRLHL